VSSILDSLPLTDRDKRAARLVAQELLLCESRVIYGLVQAGAVDDPELVAQAALALLLDTRVRTPVRAVVGEAD
jgi:hypothetical protein